MALQPDLEQLASVLALVCRVAWPAATLSKERCKTRRVALKGAGVGLVDADDEDGPGCGAEKAVRSVGSRPVARRKH